MSKLRDKILARREAYLTRENMTREEYLASKSEKKAAAKARYERRQQEANSNG